jgi:hypothetical protein
MIYNTPIQNRSLNNVAGHIEDRRSTDRRGRPLPRGAHVLCEGPHPRAAGARRFAPEDQTLCAPDDRGVADHLHRHVGKLERLDGRLPPHDSLYELGLVLEPGVGMAVAQLWQSHRLELCLVLFQPGGLQLLNRAASTNRNSYRRGGIRGGACRQAWAHPLAAFDRAGGLILSATPAIKEEEEASRTAGKPVHPRFSRPVCRWGSENPFRRQQRYLTPISVLPVPRYCTGANTSATVASSLMPARSALGC